MSANDAISSSYTAPSVFGAGLRGIADATRKLDDTAKTLTASPITPELALDISQAETQFAASAKVLSVESEATKKLLDILA